MKRKQDASGLVESRDALGNFLPKKSNSSEEFKLSKFVGRALQLFSVNNSAQSRFALEKYVPVSDLDFVRMLYCEKNVHLDTNKLPCANSNV